MKFLAEIKQKKMGANMKLNCFYVVFDGQLRIWESEIGIAAIKKLSHSEEILR